MTRYTIRLKSSARKELEALSDILFERIDSKIQDLSEAPRPTGCKKLQGQQGLWRIRIGDYRVVYSIHDIVRTVEILRVAHRSEVYGK